MRQRRNIIALLFGLMLLGGIFVLPQPHAEAAVVLHRGSTGGNVWDLQYRLKTLGYYNQAMDGKYGSGTSAAVASFQKKYGLTADGIVGSRTWNALERSSLSQNDMDILARVIYSEARGEPYEGQVAVGAVVMNRIHSNLFPNTIRGVVFQPGAFTSVSDGQFWLTPNREAYQAALDAVRGWDPTYHSLYYFNPQTATSKWIWSRPQTVTIGHHIFTK
jgi:N-acetylmuramoyl-L-alanine amidase